jgi:acyl-coenzyme A thioesterase PaaI-like protein
LRRVGDGMYEGELNKHWTIGPKLHGGVMLALCGAAAQQAYGHCAREERSSRSAREERSSRSAREERSSRSAREERSSRSAREERSSRSQQPVAVSASYLSAPNPGKVLMRTAARKRGRRVSVVDVELVQGGRVGDERSRGERVGVHAVITLGEPEHHVPPLLSQNPVVELMSPEPPPDVEPIGPGHPMFGTVNYWQGCDVRPLMSTVPGGPSTDGLSLSCSSPPQPPVIQYWVRPTDAAPDILFALLCGDISVPVAFAVGRRGWAPTVQLTAYLRGLPADGWLRVVSTTTQIGQDWFDEDALVVDCEGRIIVQSRQLALVPGH